MVAQTLTLDDLIKGLKTPEAGYTLIKEFIQEGQIKNLLKERLPIVGAENLDKLINFYSINGRYADMAYICKIKGDIKGAIDYYDLAARSGGQIQTTMQSPKNLYNTAGSLAEQMGDIEKSLELFEKAGNYTWAEALCIKNGNKEKAEFYKAIRELVYFHPEKHAPVLE